VITIIVPTLDLERGEATMEAARELAGCAVESQIVVDTAGTGFTGTVNRGIKRIYHGDICILADDCEPSQDWLAMLVAHADAYRWRKVWFAGPSGPCRTAPQNSGRPGDYRRPCIVSHVAGFCLLIKAEAIEALGGLDARFTHYASDVDLQWRGQRDHQAASLWVPGVYVGHGLHQPRADWWQHDQALLSELWG